MVLEMSTRKAYTRRNTRTRLLDLLKEAIQLVERGCPPGQMAKTPSVLSAVPEEEVAPVTQPLVQTPVTQPLVQGPVTVKDKKKPGCPGGPKAFNEFVKKWRMNNPGLTYTDSLKKIKETGVYAATCSLPGVTRKAPRTTPGRVNAIVPIQAPSKLNTISSLSSSNSNNSNSNNSNSNNSNSNNSNSSVSTLSPTPLNTVNSTPFNTENKGYKNQGMDNTVGMRKIQVNGRNLYMSSNNGLFEREGNSPGDFIGHLKNGKIVEEDAPELPEYA